MGSLWLFNAKCYEMAVLKRKVEYKGRNVEEVGKKKRMKLE